MTDSVGLYVHIPFCDAKCSYCDFVTFTDQHSQIESYIRAVGCEIKQYEGRGIETLFIGGGTPTVLSSSQISHLMSQIHGCFDASGLIEATVEANPESATPQRLEAYRDAGINRLSFGLQAAQNKLLGELGRLHSYEKFLLAYESARQLGFTNINIDLMFGLPGQTNEDWEETLRAVIALNPEHISAYALKIEPGTRMARDQVMINGDEEADMYMAASRYLTAAGYGHYEISNFSKPGHESRHNLRYWKNEDTIGVGISSASFLEGKRFKNSGRLKAYIDDCLAGRSPEREDSSLPMEERDKESVMLALRLQRGVRKEIIDGLHVPMAGTFLQRGLATVEKGMYSLTPQGWLLSNLLFEQLI